MYKSVGVNGGAQEQGTYNVSLGRLAAPVCEPTARQRVRLDPGPNPDQSTVIYGQQRSQPERLWMFLFPLSIISFSLFSRFLFFFLSFFLRICFSRLFTKISLLRAAEIL